MKGLTRGVVISLGLCLGANAFANGFSVHLQGGLALATQGSNQSLYVNSDVENQYFTSDENIDTPFIGLGVAYQWDHLFNQLPNLALNLGLSAYYLQANLHGVNTPGINQAPPGTSFDTLDYTVKESSSALMLEPKLLYTAYAWQPYVVAGIGAAWNHVGDYNETANGTTTANSDPFGSKTTHNLAYSMGFGVQHQLTNGPQGEGLSVGLDYRYMNWGEMQLSSFSGDSTGQAPDFGDLKTSLISATLIWQF